MANVHRAAGDTNGTAPVVVVRGAVKTFEVGNEPVRGLQEFDLELSAHEMCALVGISGSGKSTLLSVLGGLQRLDDGTAMVNGVDLATLTDRQLASYRARTVSSIFQEYNLLPMLTCVENVALAGYLIGLGQREADSQATEALVELGLADQLHRYPGELSGGQRQRVAIGRAVAGHASGAKTLLLADEPSGSLDSTTTESVLAALRSAARSGLAVLVATHDPHVVAAADRVVTIRDGRNGPSDPPVLGPS